MKNIFINSTIFIISTIIMLLIVEGVLRIKNSDMKNYNIEMWHYAKELKVISNNPKLGHEHKISSQAVLQSVKIRTNNYGLRGEDITIEKEVPRRILILGSSATLGWGVDENQTMAHVLGEKLGKEVEVLNAGIGNYNTLRYVELFLSKLKVLKPTDIIIHYFLNDTEDLKPADSNWFLQHSQLAVVIWNKFNMIKNRENSLENYYKEIYNKESIGFKNMKNSLDLLKEYAQKNNIRVYFAMTPDFHYLDNYKFANIHKIVEKEADIRGFIYIDLLKSFNGEYNSSEFWVMLTDPHPNALAHKLMAEYLYPYLVAK